MSAPLALVGLGEHPYSAYTMLGVMRSSERKRKPVGVIGRAVVDEDHLVRGIVQPHQGAHRVFNASGLAVSRCQDRNVRQSSSPRQLVLPLLLRHLCIRQNEQKTPAPPHQPRQGSHEVKTHGAECLPFLVDQLKSSGPKPIGSVDGKESPKTECAPEEPRGICT